MNEGAAQVFTPRLTRKEMLDITIGLTSGAQTFSGPAHDQMVALAFRLRGMIDGERGFLPPWRPIKTAPKDGTPVDLWCVPPDGTDFMPERGGIRLTACAWHETNDIFPHTGWIRTTDDGDWDLVDAEPMCPLGLPRWVPLYWMPPPDPPDAANKSAPETLSAKLSKST